MISLLTSNISAVIALNETLSVPPINTVILFSALLFFFILSIILSILNISKDRILRNQILVGRKILVAEDDAISQRIWTTLLQDNRISMTLAANGMEAVNYAKSNSFDLILMDIEMPVLNGMDATREIRERMEQEGIYIPILALTAHSAQGEKAEALLSVGFDDILTKPIDPRLLRSKLIRWLSHPSKKKSAPEERPGKSISFSSVAQHSVNIKRGLGYTDNNEELYINLLRRFVTNYGSLEINIGTPLDQDIKTKIHSLKGIAGSLGAEPLYKAALQLESSFSRQAWDPGHLENFIKKHADTITDCEEILSKYWEKNGRTQASPVLTVSDEESTAQLKDILVRLRTALAQCDPIRCREIVSELEYVSHPGFSVQMFDVILQKIAEYQYDSADSQVSKLIERIELEG